MITDAGFEKEFHVGYGIFHEEFCVETLFADQAEAQNGIEDRAAEEKP